MATFQAPAWCPWMPYVQNAAKTLPGSNIVFVCAQGLRSLTAAKLADRLGIGKVYSLDGGNSNWTRRAYAWCRASDSLTPILSTIGNSHVASKRPSTDHRRVAEPGHDRAVGAVVESYQRESTYA